MRTQLTLALGIAALVSMFLTACAENSSEELETITIKVAAHTTPMTDVVRIAAQQIEPGYRVELVEVADYIQPNMLLNNHEIDANFVQFVPFMEEFNEANNGTLVGVQPIYFTVVAFYSKTVPSLDKLTKNAHIVIPQDRANAGRALQLLADSGVIVIDKSVEKYSATINDIDSNPLDLRITQVDLLQLNAAYEEADAVFNLPAFARLVGLTPEENGIAVEQDPKFAVTLVSREDNEQSPEIAALQRAFTSDAVREVLQETGNPAAF